MNRVPVLGLRLSLAWICWWWLAQNVVKFESSCFPPKLHSFRWWICVNTLDPQGFLFGSKNWHLPSSRFTTWCLTWAGIALASPGDCWVFLSTFRLAFSMGSLVFKNWSTKASNVFSRFPSPLFWLLTISWHQMIFFSSSGLIPHLNSLRFKLTGFILSEMALSGFSRATCRSSSRLGSSMAFSIQSSALEESKTERIFFAFEALSLPVAMASSSFGT